MLVGTFDRRMKTTAIGNAQGEQANGY